MSPYRTADSGVFLGSLPRRCDLRRTVNAPAVLPGRFRIQLEAPAVVLLLGHVLDTWVDIKLE